jgi:GMP synthase-like glutamine amidotransferase
MASIRPDDRLAPSDALTGIEPRLGDRNRQERGCESGTQGLDELPCPSILHRASFRHSIAHTTAAAKRLFPRLLDMRVLSLIHQDDAPTGVFAEVVRERGDELTEWNVATSAPPERAETYDAVFVFGGAMHVDQEDRHPWLREEDELIKGLLEAKVPLFGVCLGGQLIAKAAGGRVAPAPAEEVGWHEVDLTPEAAGDPVFAALPERFPAFQWHSYAFELPPGAVPLARNSVGLQAFRVGEAAWGIQFHAEVTRQIVEGWLASDGGRHRIDLAPMEDWNPIGRELAGRFLDAAARPPRRARPAATRAS